MMRSFRTRACMVWMGVSDYDTNDDKGGWIPLFASLWTGV